MALSKHTLAMFFALLAIAATLQPSDARLRLPPIFRSLFPPLPQIPALPPLFGPLPVAPPAQGLPQTPGMPHFPPSTGSPSPPPPKECLTPLTSMIPCMDYLTNITVFSPPDACCDGLKLVVNTAPICLCHGMNNNGGMSKLFPKPIDPIRMIILPVRCGAMIPIQTIFSCAILAPKTIEVLSSKTIEGAAPAAASREGDVVLHAD
uniref:Bifunctional inhibitor/plant lipid transfer protein/seed storage helical domain-containing protein n=1 Tax=Aegilops tauschii TaxID=37682 RepID=M8C0Q1_AEGTA